VCTEELHNVSFPLITSEGYKYIINFERVDLVQFSEEVAGKTDVPVYDLNFKLYGANISDIEINNPKTLYRIGAIILDFLIENDVIIYYFCDTKQIKKGKKHEHISHQEFRHMLFTTMYRYVATRRQLDNFENNALEITGENEKYYLHFLCSQKNLTYVKILLAEFEKYNK